MARAAPIPPSEHLVIRAFRLGLDISLTIASLSVVKYIDLGFGKTRLLDVTREQRQKTHDVGAADVIKRWRARQWAMGNESI